MKHKFKLLFFCIPLLVSSAVAVSYTSGTHDVTISQTGVPYTVENSGTVLNIIGPNTVITTNTMFQIYAKNGAKVTTSNGVTLTTTYFVSFGPQIAAQNGAILDFKDTTVNIGYDVNYAMYGQIDFSDSTVNFDNVTVSNATANVGVYLFRIRNNSTVSIQNSDITAINNGLYSEGNTLTLDNTILRAQSHDVQHYAIEALYTQLTLQNNSNVQGRILLTDGVSNILDSIIDGQTVTGNLDKGIEITTTAASTSTSPAQFTLKNTTLSHFGVGLSFTGENINATIENTTLQADTQAITFENSNVTAVFSNTHVISGQTGIYVQNSIHDVSITLNTVDVTGTNPIGLLGTANLNLHNVNLVVYGDLNNLNGNGIGLFSSGESDVSFDESSILLNNDNEVGILNTAGTVNIGVDNQSVNTILVNGNITPKAAVWVGAHPNDLTVVNMPKMFIIGTLQANGLPIVIGKDGELIFGNALGNVAYIQGNVFEQESAQKLTVYTGGAISHYNYATNDPSASGDSKGSVIEGNLQIDSLVNVDSTNTNDTSTTQGTLFLVTGDVIADSIANLYFKDNVNYVNMVVGGNFISNVSDSNGIDIDFDINPDAGVSDSLWVNGDFTGDYTIKIHFASKNKLISPTRLLHVGGTLEKEPATEQYHEGPFELFVFHFDTDTTFYKKDSSGLIGASSDSFTFLAKDHYLGALEVNDEHKICVNVNGERYCSDKNIDDLQGELNLDDDNTSLTDDGYYINKSYYQPIRTNNSVLIHMLNKYLDIEHNQNFMRVHNQFVDFSIHRGTVKKYDHLNLYDVNFLYAFPSFQNHWLGTYTKVYAYGTYTGNNKPDTYGNTYLYLIGANVYKTFKTVSIGVQGFFGRSNSSLNLNDNGDLGQDNWHALDRDFLGLDITADHTGNMSSAWHYRYGASSTYTYVLNAVINDEQIKPADETIAIKGIHILKPILFGEIAYQAKETLEIYMHQNVGCFVSSKPIIDVNGLGYHETDDSFNSVTYSTQLGVRYKKNLGMQVSFSGMPTVNDMSVGISIHYSAP